MAHQPRFAILVRTLLLLLALLGTVIAHADRVPANCSGSGLGITLFTSIPDVHVGDTIYYSVNIFNGTAGITHIQGSSDIVITATGLYKVDFSVSGTEPNQFALFANGTVVANTVYGSGAGTQQNSGQAILSINANDILTLVNHSSAAAVTLATVIGGTAPNVNASVIIQKLN